MRPPARRFVEIVIVLVAWRAATAAAEPPATLRVRLDAPRTGVVRERIEGQLADLEVAIADADLACHAPLEARITYAAPDVDVLACVREQAGAISVEVIDVRARRAFVRRFSGGATSARAEEAAVALRGTLDALRLGGQLGVVLAPAPTEPPPFYDSPPESAPRGPNAVHIGGGLSSTAEGLGTELPLASYARLAFVHARLEVGVHGSLGLSRRRVFDEASIALTRHVLAIGLGYALVDTDHARLVGSGGVGLALRTRTTTTVSGGLLATARARRTDAFVHAGLRLQLSPRARGAFAFELGAGVEVPFSQASLAVQSGDVRTRLDRALPVFARFELGLLFRLDP